MSNQYKLYDKKWGKEGTIFQLIPFVFEKEVRDEENIYPLRSATAILPGIIQLLFWTKTKIS